MDNIGNYKRELEDLESTIDNCVEAVESLISKTKNTDALMSDYFTFRNNLQNTIRSIFAEGTKFGNF